MAPRLAPVRRRPWGVALLVLGGVATGVAVAGVPSRGEDPPLRIQADETSTTTLLPTSTTSSTTSSTTTTLVSAPTTSTTRRR